MPFSGTFQGREAGVVLQSSAQGRLTKKGSYLPGLRRAKPPGAGPGDTGWGGGLRAAAGIMSLS